MTNVIGGLNYDAVLSAEDYRTYRDLIESEMLSRFLLSAGGPPFAAPLTGIVDILNPTKISSAEVTRPFLVTVSTLSTLHVQVRPGTVVTPSGAVIKSSGNYDLTLARTQNNDVNVVFIENEIIEAGTNTLNDYMEDLASQEIQNPENVKVVLLSDWNNISLFPPTRKNNIVVLAVVTVLPTAGNGQELQIDLTQNTYSFNRPWFSIVDIQHRASIGTGTITETNPHGTTYNDLSTNGSVGLFQGLSNSGIIVSRDRNISKMTGAVYCNEIISLNRIKTDTDGSVTERSIYNRPNAKYCELLAFPTRLGSVFEQGKTSNSIAAEVIEGTNILVFGPNENISSALIAEYTDTSALLPPVSAPTNLLTFGLPATDEIIVAGGLTFESIPDPTLNMEGSGPFPRRYLAYQLASGSIQSYPQILIPAIKLDSIGSSLYAPIQQMQQSSRIRIGLTKADLVSTMDVEITLYGKDLNANTISEVLVLAVANGYSDEVAPSVNYDAPAQSVVSINTFSRLDNIQITARTDDGPLSTLQVWAEIEPSSTPALNDALKIAEIYWNGQGVSKIIDARKISNGFRNPEAGNLRTVGESLIDSARLISSLPSSPILNQSSQPLFTEDFEDLKYFDSCRGFAPAISSVGVLTVQNNSLLVGGDTIQLKPGKVITAVTSSPNLAIGQFLIGGSASATITNIIATVADTTFNSGITASIGTGTNVNFVLNSPLGSQGNVYDITLTLTNPLALSVSGFNFGYDAYGECYLDRSTIGIKSFRIPDNSNLIPYEYAYRERYRSRAVAVPYPAGSFTLFAVEVHGEDKYYPSSVRIRGSTYANPNVWLPWSVMTVTANGVKGLYSHSFANPTHKIQVEYYGRARGITAYQLKANI